MRFRRIFPLILLGVLAVLNSRLSVQVETAWGRFAGGGYQGIATDLADFWDSAFARPRL